MSAHYISFFMKRVYYNDMTQALAHLKAFKPYYYTVSALYISAKM